MNLSTLSITELRNLQEEIKLELTRREQQEITKARDQILAIAKSVGIPVQELIAKSGQAKTTNKVAVQYRNPENTSQEWTGRGRQPGWVKAWVESGKNIDALKI